MVSYWVHASVPRWKESYSRGLRLLSRRPRQGGRPAGGARRPLCVPGEGRRGEGKRNRCSPPLTHRRTDAGRARLGAQPATPCRHLPWYHQPTSCEETGPGPTCLRPHNWGGAKRRDFSQSLTPKLLEPRCWGREVSPPIKESLPGGGGRAGQSESSYRACQSGVAGGSRGKDRVLTVGATP